LNKIKIFTWGTGGSFGRILGYKKSYEFLNRGNTSTSIIGYNNDEEIFHILIDVGAPCVEKIIDNKIGKIPDALFITHLHNDHISDFDKFVCSRYRGLIFNTRDALIMENIIPDFNILSKEERCCIIKDIKMELRNDQRHKIPVIGNYDTINADFGVRYTFKYLDRHIEYNIPENNDTWYGICSTDNKIYPSSLIKTNMLFPLEFKLINLEHNHAPGACMYIFRTINSSKEIKLVFSGDFVSKEISRFNKNQLADNDIKNPDFVLLETSALFARSENHTNWIENTEILKSWFTEKKKTKPKVLLNHIGGYEDFEQGFFPDMPDDKLWYNTILDSKKDLLDIIDVEISHDCYCHTINF